MRDHAASFVKTMSTADRRADVKLTSFSHGRFITDRARSDSRAGPGRDVRDIWTPSVTPAASRAPLPGFGEAAPHGRDRTDQRQAGQGQADRSATTPAQAVAGAEHARSIGASEEPVGRHLGHTDAACPNRHTATPAQHPAAAAGTRGIRLCRIRCVRSGVTRPRGAEGGQREQDADGGQSTAGYRDYCGEPERRDHLKQEQPPDGGNGVVAGHVEVQVHRAGRGQERRTGDRRRGDR